ncbi:MAG: BamA/TamA family outer membrane protein [Flavobacteriia bacterium]|nr:BamA/TamA family outer membrane protein [Flavobacteriia bacterium]
MTADASSHKFFVKVSFILLGITISGCNALKNIPEGEVLLRKNEIIVEGNILKKESVNNLILQQPNTYVFGTPLKLHLYNLNKNTNKENWKQRLGEAAVIVDPTLSKRSAKRLAAYYETLGHFNAQVSTSLIKHPKKPKATVLYEVQAGPVYTIDSLGTQFFSRDLDSLYQASKNESFIKTGTAFTYDNFDKERDRISRLARNNGIYNFQESAVSFTIKRDTVQKNNSQKMNVVLTVKNPQERNEQKATPYAIKKISRVNIFADTPLNAEKNTLDSLLFQDFTIFYNKKLSYKPKVLTDPIYLNKGRVYSEENRQQSFRKLSSLNTFKYPNITVTEDKQGQGLITNVFLNSKDTYAAQINLDVTHSNIQRLGLAFSSSLMARNLFGGAETLSLSGRGSVGVLGDAALSSEKYLSEVGADINLSIPNLWFPFISLRKLVSKNSLPQTRISIGSSFQKNIGLDKQTINVNYQYNWTPSEFIRLNASLLQVQYVQNLNPERFYEVYRTTYNRLNNLAKNYLSTQEYSSFFDDLSLDNPSLVIPNGANGFSALLLENEPTTSDEYKEVKRIEERRDRLTENNLISSSQFTFTKNNKKEITDPDFYQFRMTLESAGNLLGMLSNIIDLETQADGTKLLAGVPYAQYFKTELDYIKHWRLGRDQSMAFRGFGGIAIPYGNANTVPFARSYFAGGSNDNRAWNAYSLGPGSTDNINDFNEANLKLAFNLEYRFPLIGSFKGALFVDAGNIWNALDGVNDPDRSFQGFSSLSQMALGSGFGVRYDFDYFVFRLDAGFKTYDPAQITSKRWFRDYNFANSVINIGINYPF